MGKEWKFLLGGGISLKERGENTIHQRKYTLSARMIIILNPTQLIVKSCLFFNKSGIRQHFSPKKLRFVSSLTFFSQHKRFRNISVNSCHSHYQPPNTFATISLFRKEKTPDLLNTFKNIVADIIKPTYPTKHLKVMMYLKQKTDS